MLGKLCKFKFTQESIDYLKLCSRSYSGTGFNTNISDTERKLVQLLQTRFPNASEINVADVSGGCGAMFDVTVISPEFKDISLVKQHRMVNDALKNEIKQMHGLRISTHYEPTSNEKS